MGALFYATRLRWESYGATQLHQMPPASPDALKWSAGESQTPLPILATRLLAGRLSLPGRCNCHETSCDVIVHIRVSSRLVDYHSST